MKMFEVTYLVDNLRVQGYLGLPDGIGLTDEDIQEAVRQAADAPIHLPIRQIPMDQVPVLPGVGSNALPESISAHTDGVPGLLYCRGGIGRVGMSRLEWISTFCSLGFAVFSPWYRGTLGTEGRDQFGGEDVRDCVVGFRILQRLAGVRASEISVLGFSRGSINATLTTVAEPTANGLILWGGVSDVAATYEERVDLRRMLRRVIGGTPRRFPEAYAVRSPIRYANKIPCRTLVIHSTHDSQVAFHHGHDMYRALHEAGVAVSWHGYEGYGHHFDAMIRDAVIDRMLSWARS